MRLSKFSEVFSVAVGVKYDWPGPENVAEVEADPSRTEFRPDPPLRVVGTAPCCPVPRKARGPIRAKGRSQSRLSLFLPLRPTAERLGGRPATRK